MSNLRPKCTKFNFGWGSAPGPVGGAYSAPPGLLAGFKGLLLRGREGKGGCGERGGAPSTFFCGSTPMVQLGNALNFHS